MILKILLGWCIFVALVYVWMWVDYVYYKYELPKVYRNIIDAFTEEE